MSLISFSSRRFFFRQAGHLQYLSITIRVICLFSSYRSFDHHGGTFNVPNVDTDGHSEDSLRRRSYTIEKGKAQIAKNLFLERKIIIHLRVKGKYWNILL